MSNKIEISTENLVIFGSAGTGYIEFGRNAYESVEVPLSDVPFLLQVIQQVADFIGGDV